MRREFKNLLKKKFQLRLAIAIPLIFTFFVFSLALFNFLLVGGIIKNSYQLNAIDNPSYAGLLKSFYFYQVFILVYAGVIGLILGYAFVFPLKKTTYILKKISKGDYTAIVDLGSDKETAELSIAFNRMLSSLNNYILESISSGILTLDKKERIININSSAASLLGVSPAEVAFKDIRFIIPPGGQNAPFYEVIDSALGSSASASSAELDVITKENLKVSMGISTSLLKDKGDTLLGVVLNFRDLNQLKKEMRKRELTQRLSSLGRLALGVVHEVRNPLASVRGLIKMVYQEGVPLEKRQEYFEVILRELDRLENLSSELLALSPRRKGPSMSRININYLIDESLKLGMLRGDKRIEIIKNYYNNIPEISADASLLKQAFLNIIINAVDAMDGEGVLTVNTFFEDNRVEIEIQDTGKGLSSQVKDKVFEPFFTTKEAGIGLGLSVVSNIVNIHKGTLEIMDNNPQGAIVRVTLPAV